MHVHQDSDGICLLVYKSNKSLMQQLSVIYKHNYKHIFSRSMNTDDTGVAYFLYSLCFVSPWRDLG